MDKSTVLVLDNHMPSLMPAPTNMLSAGMEQAPPAPVVEPMQQNFIINRTDTDDEMRILEERLQNSARIRQLEAKRDTQALEDLQQGVWKLWNAASRKAVAQAIDIVPDTTFTDMDDDLSACRRDMKDSMARVARLCRRDYGSLTQDAHQERDLTTALNITAGAAIPTDGDVHTTQSMYTSLATLYAQDVFVQNNLVDGMMSGIEKELASALTFTKGLVKHVKDNSRSIHTIADLAIRDVDAKFGRPHSEPRGGFVMQLDTHQLEDAVSRARDDTAYTNTKQKMQEKQLLRREIDRVTAMEQALLQRQADCATEKIGLMKTVIPETTQQTSQRMHQLTLEYEALTQQLVFQEHKRLQLQTKWRELRSGSIHGGGPKPSSSTQRTARQLARQPAVQEARRTAVRDRLTQQIKHEMQLAANTMMAGAEARLAAHEHAAVTRLQAMTHELQLQTQKAQADIGTLMQGVQTQIAIRRQGPWAETLGNMAHSQTQGFMVDRTMKHLDFLEECVSDVLGETSLDDEEQMS